MKKLLGAFVFYSILVNSISAQCLEGDCQEGTGIIQSDNGNKYSGTFHRGRMHGKGNLLLDNGNSYNGDWVNGMREGIGVYTFSSGNVYTGSFKRNKFSGQGTMTFHSGNKYVGNWENDQPNGTGIYYFTTNDRYEGNFASGKFNGTGKMYYQNRDVYVGEWTDNARNGDGTLTKSTGETISGQWINGNPALPNNNISQASTISIANSNEFSRDCNTGNCIEGKGTYIYRDGSKWVGEFKNSMPEGSGTCYYANSDKYIGKFEKHAPHGEGTMYYRDGRIMSAIWEYGRPIGELPSNSKLNETEVAVDYSPEVKIWAVVVGVGRYATMPTLKYTVDDAYHYYAFLKSPEGGALPDNQIKVLVNEDATRNNILQTMRQTLLQADENDVIMFYFSGHGLEGAFIPQDFDGLNNKLYHSEVKAIFEKSKAKHKICIADACNSGSLIAMKTPYAEAMKQYYKAFEDTKGGMVLFMSSKKEEFSLEDQGLRSGIFSHYLIRGLKGDADEDHNKIITMRELYDFVYKNVRVYTSNAQNPTISGNFDWNMPLGTIR